MNPRVEIGWQSAADGLRDAPTDNREEQLRDIHVLIGQGIRGLGGGPRFIRYEGRRPISDATVAAVAARLEELDPTSLVELKDLNRMLNAKLPSPRYERS
jgi:hypothetical protein